MKEIETPQDMIDFLQNLETSMIENSKSVAEEYRRDSTQWIKIAHKLSAYKSYLIYLKEEGQIQEYFEYLNSEKELVEENNSSRRATERMKEELPDKCVACGFDNPEYHHIKPYRHGGETTVKNLAPLCEWCHKIIEQAEYQMAEIVQDSWQQLHLFKARN